MMGALGWSVLEERPVDRRKYVRHPADVPIVVQPQDGGSTEAEDDLLEDVGFGGLSFHSKDGAQKGALLNVTIPSVQPGFHIHARVVWCEASDTGFDVGVQFVEPEQVYQARMIEQICQIEHYRNEVFEKEGRHLTGEEAAREWQGKHGNQYPVL